jgi:hypothetical protein
MVYMKCFHIDILPILKDSSFNTWKKLILMHIHSIKDVNSVLTAGSLKW